MKLSMIVTAVAASALMSGAALAQVTDPAAPSTTTTTEPSATPAPTADPTLPAGQSTTTTTTTTAPAAPAADTGTATSTSVTTSDTATGASATVTTLTNGPVPDTAENRAKYGGPMSHAGKRTAAKGN